MTHVSLNEKFKRAASVICKQGMVAFPVSDTAITIIKKVVGEYADELDLIYAFRHAPSQTEAQLRESSGMMEEKIQKLATRLAKKGLVFNQPNSSGIMVYRVLPLMMVGLMEYKFMVELKGSKEERELAVLFETLLNELKDQTQSNLATLKPVFETAPPLDRTIPTRKTEDGKEIKVLPIGQPIDIADEFVLPSQTVEEIINKFEDIAVGHCFCRQRHKSLGNECSTQAPTMNCFTFGKSARHTVSNGFATKIDKKEALKILKEAESAGLIHKAFHPASKESKPETSICNCCKDCCDVFRLWREGTLPLINSTYHLSLIDRETCSGCGICVDWCPTDAISLDDDGPAQRDESACLGCGVCARFCPEEAISLKEKLRKVFIMPPQHRASS
jgi:Pyruvate/2-oxoacid:ferredoxin oxidoreductase delta subunit